MTRPTVVDQAVELLRQRLREADAERVQLEKEQTQIRDALARLGYGNVPVSPRLEDAAQAEQRNTRAPSTSGTISIAEAVRELVQRERGPWTPSAIRDELARAGIQGDRSDKRFGDVIRTALYTLRKRNEIVTDENHASMATKWCTDAEAPVAAGASETEEPSSGSSRQEGDSRELYAILPRGGDHDPDYSGRDLHHG